MTKQEFINFSLDKGLKVQTKDGTIETIKGVIGTSYCISDFPKYGMYGDCEDANIICRPLSDITKPIEHNGEKFVPIDKLNELAFNINPTWFMYEEDVEDTDWKLQPFFIVQQLAKWHFNLMDENETFIDVNTLETNPYK